MCPLGWILKYFNTIVIMAFMGGYELIRPESGYAFWIRQFRAPCLASVLQFGLSWSIYPFEKRQAIISALARTIGPGDSWALNWLACLLNQHHAEP